MNALRELAQFFVAAVSAGTDSVHRGKLGWRIGVLAGIAAALLIACHDARAASVSLNETVNASNWTTSGIWYTANGDGTPSATSHAAPVAGDDVYVGFESSTAMTSVVFNVAGALSLDSLSIDARLASPFTLTQNTAATLLTATTETVGVASYGADYELLSGTNTVSGTLIIGTGAAGQGKYHVGSGTTAFLNATVINLGGNNSTQMGGNQIVQDGGTVTVSSLLSIAPAVGSTGFYTLNNGRLNSPQSEYVGYNGTGTFTQTGGTNSVGQNLFVSEFNGSVGSYTLNSGYLTAQNEYVAYSGTTNGTFIQTGGTNSVPSGSLLIASDYPGTGSYTLNGGRLAVGGTESIGCLGTGAFTQSGGTNTTPLVVLGDWGVGVYNLSGGVLSSSTVALAEDYGSATFTQSGGTNAVAAFLEVGAGGQTSGTYNLSGHGVLTALDEMLGEYGYYDPVNGSEGSNGAFIQTGGINTVANTLYLGFFYDTMGSYTLGGNGILTAQNEVLGNYTNSSAVFTQTGGTNTVTNLLELGCSSSYASYTLSGSGVLTTPTELIGVDGVGAFTQTGGTNSVTGSFSVGYNPYASGSYALSGGLLSVPLEFIGDSGNGAFTQSGGVNSVSGSMSLGFNNGSNGSYNLNSGLVSALCEFIGNSGTGVFTQSGGTNAATSGLWLGYSGNSSGTYNLNGGLLSAPIEFIGFNNAGTFTQTGGVNTVTGGLTISNNSGVGASYNLSGGVLNLPSVAGANVIGTSGAFTQSSGVENGYLLNNGMFTFNGGTFNGTLENGLNGMVYLGTTLIAGGGVLNNGNITVNSGIGLGASGSGGSMLTNNGFLAVYGGTLTGAGAILNNGNMTVYGAITGSGGFTNNTILTQNGPVTFSNTGLNYNYGNMALLGGIQFKINSCTFNNGGTLLLSSGTGLGTMGGILAGSGTLVNIVGGNIVGIGTILSGFANSGGTIDAGLGTLNIVQGFTNNGVIQLGGIGSSLVGGQIANSDIIQGQGSVGNTVVNNGTIQGQLTLGAVTNNGIIEPLGGVLSIGGALQNSTAGTIRVATGNKLIASSGLGANAGVISLTGGTFDNNGHSLNNTNEITGYGTLATGGLTNNGSMTFIGGVSTINGNVTNSSGQLIKVANDTAIFTGNVINSGTFKVTGATAAFGLSFINYGVSIGDSNSQIFNSLTVEPTGSVTGGAAVGSLQMTGGNIASGPGTLILNGTLTTTANSSAALISGKLDLGGTNRSINVAKGSGTVDLAISAAIADGGIVKTGAGKLQLSGSLSLSDLNADAGITELDSALPNADIVVAAGAELDLYANAGASMLSVSGTARITTNQNLSSLTVGSAATVIIAPHSANPSTPTVLNVGSLVFPTFAPHLVSSDLAQQPVATPATDSAASGTPEQVPEPGTLGLLLTTALGLLARRSRKVRRW